MTEEQGIAILTHLDRIHWLLVALILCNGWILGGVIWRVICYAKGSGSLWAVALVLVLPTAAMANEPEFIIKPSSLGTDYDLKGQPSNNLTITKEAGGIFSLRFDAIGGGTHAGQADIWTTPHFYEVDPQSTSKNYGINGPTGITFKGTFDVYYYNASHPFILVFQDGNVWELEGFIAPISWDGVERYGNLTTTTLIEGSGTPDYTRPYKLAVRLWFPNTAHDSPDHNGNVATIEKLWVHLSGGDGEDSSGGPGGPGGPGDGDGGGGKPPGDTGGEPGDGTEDPDPADMKPPEGEPDEGSPTEHPCWADLEAKLRAKFQLEEPTIGAADQRYEIKLRIGALEGDALERSYYIPLKIDESWEPGQALVKWLGWARNVMIFFILFTLFRSIMWDIVQW